MQTNVVIVSRDFFFWVHLVEEKERINRMHFISQKWKFQMKKSRIFWRHVFGFDHKCETIINANWTYDDDCSFSVCVCTCQTMSPKPHFRSLHVAVYYEVFSGLPMNKLLPIIKLQINGCDDIKQSVLIWVTMCILRIMHKLSNHTKTSRSLIPFILFFLFIRYRNSLELFTLVIEK